MFLFSNCLNKRLRNKINQRICIRKILIILITSGFNLISNGANDIWMKKKNVWMKKEISINDNKNGYQLGF